MDEKERLKIFLAEDEFVVREGIKKNIDWEAHGYEFVGEAGDGELAYPMIQKEKPDILITDIRMPFMNGLELSKLVKKEFPDTEIIILSGFEEFEYAREGIKIGVAEYLLKPISAASLLAEIEKVAEKIKKRREEEALRKKYLAEMKETASLERRDLFKHLVSGDVSTSNLIQMAKNVNVSITAVNYCIVLLKLVSSAHAEDEYSRSLVIVDDDLEKEAGELGAISFDRTPEGRAYLFMADCADDVEKKIEIFKTHPEVLVKGYPTVSFFGGIGSIVGRISEVQTSYAIAGKAFAYRFFEKESKFRTAEAEDLHEVYRKDDFNIEDVNPGQVSRNEVTKFLKAGSLDETSYFVDAFFKRLGENALNSFMFRQYIAMDAYFATAGFVESIGSSRDKVENFNATSDILSSMEETGKYIVRIVSEAIKERERLTTNKYESVVNEVYQYVDNNFADEELSLNKIAAVVNFSPSHLSMIFSQETGNTLIRYITDVRMTKAKELLRCTAKRSSEISRLTGYPDPHYFSYLFKKTQGMTPTQYRGGNTRDDIKD